MRERKDMKHRETDIEGGGGGTIVRGIKEYNMIKEKGGGRPQRWQWAFHMWKLPERVEETEFEEEFGVALVYLERSDDSLVSRVPQPKLPTMKASRCTSLNLSPQSYTSSALRTSGLSSP